MKAKLTFDFDIPEDKTAHLRAIKSLDMASVLFDIRNTLRTAEKNDMSVDLLISTIREHIS